MRGWQTARHARSGTSPTLPKAHLHLHFTGSMRPAPSPTSPRSTASGCPRPCRGHHLRRLTPDERGWFRFQRLYDAARACVRDAEDMRRIVLEAAEDDAAEGSRLAGAAGRPDVLRAVRRLAHARARDRPRRRPDGVSGRRAATSRSWSPPAASATRSTPARSRGSPPATPATAPATSSASASPTTSGAATEDFAPAFAIAARAGLAAVPHSGELLGPDLVRTDLERAAPRPARPRRPRGRGPRAARPDRPRRASAWRSARQQRRARGLPDARRRPAAPPGGRRRPHRPRRRRPAAVRAAARRPVPDRPRRPRLHRRRARGARALVRRGLDGRRATVRKRLLAGIDDWLASR